VETEVTPLPEIVDCETDPHAVCELELKPLDPPVVEAVAEVAEPVETLALTGVETTAGLGAGFGLLAIGSVLLWASGRRRTA
jgi:predicted RNA methylase